MVSLLLPVTLTYNIIRDLQLSKQNLCNLGFQHFPVNTESAVKSSKRQNCFYCFLPTFTSFNIFNVYFTHHIETLSYIKYIAIKYSNKRIINEVRRRHNDER